MSIKDLRIGLHSFLTNLGLLERVIVDVDNPRTAGVMGAYRYRTLVDCITKRMGLLYGHGPTYISLCDALLIDLDKCMNYESNVDLILIHLMLNQRHMVNMGRIMDEGGEWYYIQVSFRWTNMDDNGQTQKGKRIRSGHGALLVFDLVRRTYTFWDPNGGDMYIYNTKNNREYELNRYDLFLKAEKKNIEQRGYWLLNGFKLDINAHQRLTRMPALQDIIEIKRAGVFWIIKPPPRARTQ